MRKYLVGALVITLVLFGASLALLLPGRCPVNRAAFMRIEAGMTRARVEKILGGPAGFHQTRPAVIDPEILMMSRDWDDEVAGTWETWVGDEAEVQVCFNDGVVVAKKMEELKPIDIGYIGL